ncbi:MAG TPA: hypothetical protein ENO27_03885 [Caldithrix sp.]|nr:hypothetical protein [Caldithrix sp.]
MLRSVERRAKRIIDEKEMELIAAREFVETEHGLVRRPFNINLIIAKRLQENNIVQIESNKITINKKFVKELNDFISYLKLI